MTIRELTVATADPYPVLLGHDVLPELASWIPAETERIAIVCAPHVTDLAQRIGRAVNDRQVLKLVAPDGEGAKTVSFLAGAWDALAEAGFTRSDLVIGVGGGATTDVAGFLAASWLRGVRFITVPTTILAMVDAAVGGKTGINIAAGKNLVGAFHEPIGVLGELSALATLPAREIRGGLAEVIKCGFIADPSILDDIESDLNGAMDPASDLLADLVMRGIAVKADTVARDLRETGADGTIGREALNYGHTLGHAIERHENYRIRHGEAISVGMVFAAELSRRAGLIDEAIVRRHRDVLGAVGLPLGYGGANFAELLAGMKIDKKTRGSTLRFVVLDALASPRILAGPDESWLQAAFETIDRE